jgi:HAD superfamily hydrolase (TIGR01490 family)
MRRAALFDMDRTLVRKETASLYVRFQRERGEATLRDLAQVLYWVAQYTLGVIDAQAVARRAIAGYAGTEERFVRERCDEFFRTKVVRHVADRGREAIARHRANGDLIAIVTGATPYIAGPLGRLLGIEHVLASELEVDAQGRFTGRPKGTLCIGEGKVVRALALAEAEGFRLEDAAFYTDSLTDLPLLERVREPVAVNPDPRLRRLARRRGWRVERW